MSTYRVVVTRENGAWLADVPTLPGTHTWARNLPALDLHIREVIALAADLPEGADIEAGLDLDYEYRTGDPALDALTQRLRSARARIKAEERKIEEETAAAAREMVEGPNQLSVRDAATLLSVSPQRVSQIAPRARTAPRTRRTREKA